MAAQGTYLAKERFGMPTGTAPVGVVGRSETTGEYRRNAKKTCAAAAAAIAQEKGADFRIYSSIAKAKGISPASTMADAMVAYNAETLGSKLLRENHVPCREF